LSAGNFFIATLFGVSVRSRPYSGFAYFEY